MCIAVPAKIEEILEDDAIVNYNGVKVKVNIIYAVMTVPVIIFCFGCAMQAQLLKCPVCGKKYPHTFDRFKTYPVRCPNCGVFLGDKIDAVNEHIHH